MTASWVGAAAVVLALLLFVGYLAVGYFAYHEYSVVKPACAAGEFGAQTPADFTAVDTSHQLVVDAVPYRFTDFEEVAFRSRDRGLTIRAWYAPGPRGTARPAVVLVHGQDDCRRHPSVMLPAGMLHRAGFTVLPIDLRNHGDSDSDNGRWAGGVKEYRDVLGAWDWLLAQGHPLERIGLFGVSLGAGTVAIAMGEEPRVRAAWLDSSYASVTTASAEYAVEKRYPSWVAAAAVAIGRLIAEPELGSKSPDEEVRKLAGRPFAIVHGLQDQTVLPHHAVDLAKAAFEGGTNAVPWIVPGAPHMGAMLVAPEEYEARLLAFFRGALGA